jgi:TPP-dependent pyruvate/acetoin dehydrogenase alpha subunit
VKRFPAFDPPEYVQWAPDPALVAAYRATTLRDGARQRRIATLGQTALLDLYAGLVRTRLQDITLKRWVMTGVLSKAWLGTGEEAATVGPVHALDRGIDVVAPMIRNAGACAEMGMPIADGFRAYLATADAPSGGRDLHVGSWRHRVLQPVSPIGDLVPVVAGIALAAKLRNEPTVALTWVGDGSTAAGAAHEGFGFAAVQRVPAIFIVQNNQVALGTRVDQHHIPGTLERLPEAYGMAGGVFDGNNVLDAWAATSLAAERCRAGDGPVMLVAETFRMGGHATHDEREARATLPPEWFASWGQRDPIGLFEEYLKAEGVSAGTLVTVEGGVEAAVLAAEQEALASRESRVPDPASALRGVYADPA